MRLRMVYQSWLNGDDLKQIMTKPTFYRVRKQLEKYGVDIATATPKEKQRCSISPIFKSRTCRDT